MSNAERPLPSGLILIDKPQGWTSFDVVAKVRGVISRDLRKQQEEGRAKGEVLQQLPKRFKVGHTGTLDPLATGLLVLAVGSATKRIQSLTKLDKTYIVDAIFGAVSTTGDGEGDITTTIDGQPPSKTAVEAALERFTGKIMQKPPAYSAIKINGQRAYKLARAGKPVALEPRPVTIYEISHVKYEWPRLRFTVHVSSGTYIRSLVADIGAELGVGACMSGLRRTKVGSFELQDAHESPEAISSIADLNIKNEY